MSKPFASPEPLGVAGPTPPPHVMRGPAHADNYRLKVGRYKERWYVDPLPADERWSADNEARVSVSTAKGASGKDWTFVSLKRIAHADDLPEIAAKGYFERDERLKVINALELSQAMRRGTNVHTYAECLAYGITPTLGPSDDGGPWFPMVEKMWAELAPELVAAEMVAMHRSLNGLGYGGTTDGIFRIFGGLYLVDWKSRGEDSDHDCYPEEAGQGGAYAGADYLIVADDDPANPHGAKRIDVPKLDGGLIVSIKPDSYEVHPFDLAKAFDHWQAMHAWWMARRDEGKIAGNKWAPRRAVGPVVSYEDREAALIARHSTLHAEQQQRFAEAVQNIDRTDLDAIERLLDDIVEPPKVIDLAKRRMAHDAEREEADRRLAAEGGRADPDDVKVFEARWELGVTAPGKRWIGHIVNEALQDDADFRLSDLPSQRRCDLYCALTEWTTCDGFDWNHDEQFIAILATVGATPVEMPQTVGKTIGTLTTEQAAVMRHVVTEVANDRMMLAVADSGAMRWVPK